MQIKKVGARKIRDSRRDYTIEVRINKERASSPNGKSKGEYETPSYYKNSLDESIKAINSLEIKFSIEDFSDLEKLEQFLIKKFKLKNIKQFGANSLFALESAILKSLARSKKVPVWRILNPSPKKMPVPVGNIIGGGLHSEKKKNHPEFQEFLIIPQMKTSFYNVKLMRKLHKLIKKIIKSTGKNDEGAWLTSYSNEKILDLLSRFDHIKIGVDIASSTFYSRGRYIYKNKILSPSEQVKYINHLINKYSLFYIEDPLEENDFKSFVRIRKSKSHLVVGDDLTATQLIRIKKAIKLKSINSLIIKPNQNGSLLELSKIFKLCKKNKIVTILSHRSGETKDNVLADYAVGYQADYIKCGISTPWRKVKLNRLIKIEEEISKLKKNKKL